MARTSRVMTGRRQSYANTRAPGLPVLSDAEAANRINPAPFERRGLNATQNARVPTAGEVASYVAAAPVQPYQALVTGDVSQRVQARFGRAPTTDEWIQWSANKWGIDENLFRAVAVQETLWYQNALGDWVSDANISNYTSYGITQVKGRVGQVAANSGWPGTYPLSQLSTAFNVDYYGRAFRSAYDGQETWLNDGTNSPLNGRPYTTGDEYGSVGIWFAGHWYTTAGNSYADAVYGFLSAQTWTGFDGRDADVLTPVNDEGFEDTSKSATDLGYTVAAGQTNVPMPNNRNTYVIFGSRSYTLINGSSGAWVLKSLPGGGYHETTYHSRVYFKAAAAPTNDLEIMTFRTTGAATVAAVRLPAGLLTPTLLAGPSTTVYTGPALVAGQVYRFEMKVRTTSGGYGFLELLVDGTTVYTSPSPRGVLLQANPAGVVLLGQPSGAAGNNFSWDKWKVSQNATAYPGA